MLDGLRSHSRAYAVGSHIGRAIRLNLYVMMDRKLAPRRPLQLQSESHSVVEVLPTRFDTSTDFD